MAPRKNRGGRGSGASGSRVRGPPPPGNRQTQDGSHGRPEPASAGTPRAQTTATPRNPSTPGQNSSTLPASVAAGSSSLAPSTSSENPRGPLVGPSANVYNPPTYDQAGRGPATPASATPGVNPPTCLERALLSSWPQQSGHAQELVSYPPADTRGDSASKSMQGSFDVDNMSFTQVARRNQGPRNWDAEPFPQGSRAGPFGQHQPERFDVDNTPFTQVATRNQGPHNWVAQSSSQGARPGPSGQRQPEGFDADNTPFTQVVRRNQGPRNWGEQPSSQAARSGPSGQRQPESFDVDNAPFTQVVRRNQAPRNWGDQPSSQGSRAGPFGQRQQIPSSGPQYNPARRDDSRALTGRNLDNGPRFHCNHFPATFTPSVIDKVIHHYTVSIKKLPRLSTSVSSGQEQQADDDAAEKEIENMRKFKNLNKRVMRELQNGRSGKELQRFAYDGVQSLYTMGPLMKETTPAEFQAVISFTVDLPRNSVEPAKQMQPDHYKVTITFCNKINPHKITDPTDHDGLDQTVLMALNVLLHHYASAKRYLTIRQNYYDSSRKSTIAGGLECWEGFHSSFRLSYVGVNNASRRLTLNLNATMTTVFTQQEVAKFIYQYLHVKDRSQLQPRPENLNREMSSNSWNIYELQEVSKVLNGVRVQVTHTGRRYMVQEITRETSNSKKFKLGDNDSPISVTEYFQRKYFPLQHPDWPLLLMQGGSKKLRVYMPLEVCEIVNAQRYKKPMNADQRTAVLRQSQSSPQERKEYIDDALRQNAYGDDETMTSFGVEITPKMIEVTGHMLNAPELATRKRTPREDVLTFTPRGGDWNFNDKKMIDGKKILEQGSGPGKTLEQAPRNWAVYTFVDWNWLGNGAREIFACDDRGLPRVCRDKGMGMTGAQIFEEAMDVKKFDAEERIRRMMEKIRPLRLILLVVILPDKSSNLYGPLKRIGECEHGLVTQCVVKPQNSDQYLTNIALKINLKLGGSNSNLHYNAKIPGTACLPNIWEEPTCIFGLDVSHGSPGDTGYPSIAAVVASVEWKAWSRYAPQVRDQAPNTEMIDDLELMVVELLKEFRTNLLASPHNKPEFGGLPSQIIIYRDGVSESQFSQVKTIELPEFRKACAAVGGKKYNPKITLIIVQKRHHTRFFPIDPNYRNSINYNMGPGTVVDNGVCHSKVRGKDFFLCSHKNGIKLGRGQEGDGATSRPSHYTVLENEIGFTDRQIQDLTNSLCYCFGRATKAVSMPAPAYCAHVAAKHFRNFVVRHDTKGYTFPQVHANLKHREYRMFYI